MHIEDTALRTVVGNSLVVIIAVDIVPYTKKPGVAHLVMDRCAMPNMALA